MRAAGTIALLWLLFAATHIGLSSGTLRPRFVARLGDAAYTAFYSLVALAIFVPLVWVYVTHRHEGALLYALSVAPPARYAIFLLQGFAWMLVVGGLVQASPASLGKDPAKTPRYAIHGVTRHPLFMGVGLFGALHLPFSGFTSDVAFFVGFPLFALLGCWHQDRRKLVSAGAAFAEFVRTTSFLPLGSALSWRSLRGLPRWLPLAGAALAALLRLLHAPLFRA